MQHERNSNHRQRRGEHMLSADQTATEIKRIINDDPTISEGRRIIVTASRKGFIKKKESIHLDGSVHTDTDRKKAEDIARQYSGNRELVNEIQVLH